MVESSERLHSVVSPPKIGGLLYGLRLYGSLG